MEDDIEKNDFSDPRSSRIQSESRKVTPRAEEQVTTSSRKFGHESTFDSQKEGNKATLSFKSQEKTIRVSSASLLNVQVSRKASYHSMGEPQTADRSLTPTDIETDMLPGSNCLPMSTDSVLTQQRSNVGNGVRKIKLLPNPTTPASKFQTAAANSTKVGLVVKALKTRRIALLPRQHYCYPRGGKYLREMIFAFLRIAKIAKFYAS